VTTAVPPVHTVLALLFGPGPDSPDALAHWIASADPQSLGRTLKGLPGATREAAVREVAAAAGGLLNINLVDLLVAGWRKHQDLTSAARRTLAAPGSTELVELATHQVTEAQQPYISVLVDGHRVATLNLDLSVVFDVSALLAEISAGRLVALHSGHCDITATLAVEGADVATRQTRFELPGVISFGEGIRLLPADDYQPGAERAAAAAYVTMVQIPAAFARAAHSPGDAFAAVGVVSVPLHTLADSSLAQQLSARDVNGFFAGLAELLGEDSFAGPVSIQMLDVSPDALGQISTVQRLVGCALRSETAQEAQDYWNSGRRPDENEQQFVDLITQADLLAEHSKARRETFEQTALKVAGGIGGGAMAAGAAVIHAAGVTGVVVAIAGPAGIALVGIGAAYITYRLLTRRRPQPA